MSLHTRISEDSQEIINYIHLGTFIPVLSEFKKYIMSDLKAYDAKVIFLEKKLEAQFGEMTENIIGMTLIFGDSDDILYFGFFNVYDHKKEHIEFLLNALIDFGKSNNFQKIRGPINIPTVIYGWGFMVEGSKKDLFIGCPINPPIYQKIFKKKGFKILFKEDRYDMPSLKLNPHKVKKLIELGINEGDYQNNFFDTGNYPYQFMTLGKDEITPKIFDEVLLLYSKYMPPSGQITPKKAQNGKNIINFIEEFGAKWMMWFVREKKTGKLVANGYAIPNVFDKNEKEELNSMGFQSWVVHPNHRRNYLSILMYGFVITQAKDRKTPHYIKRGLWPVGAENIANANAAKKMGGKKSKSHLILQLLIS
ncbi:MAG: hypothetical protein EU549_02130 [Promethearchaeota archaeon]|nr:MAG: hypothetical protein EU549_02130 [Candidatus Lokiarchaeota archaeon]